MIALARKDLTAAAPIWAAAVVVLLLALPSTLGDDLGTGSPWRAFREASGGVELLTLFAFATGHWLAASEARDGSLAFLDGLPVRRGVVFLVKAVVGFGPVALLLAGWAAMDLGVLALTTDAYHADPTLPALALAGAVVGATLGFYGLGLGLSWLAELGWGALLMTMFALLVVADAHPPLQVLMPGDGFPNLEAWDGIPRVDPRPVAFWLAVGALGALASAWRFVRWDTTRTLDLGCAMRALLYATSALGLLLLLLIAALGVAGTSWGRLLAETRTARAGSLVFLYDPRVEADARVVVGAAAGIDARVRELFGVGDALRLDVEMMGTAEFHAGRFNGGKIRLAPDASPRVLAHELAHAYTFVVAGRSLRERRTATDFFVEGVAEWAEGRVFPDADADEEAWWTAAAIRATGQADFDELTDADARAEEHDVAQIYPLGRTFVLTLAEQEGDDAPRCLLQALRDTAGEDLDGLALWYRLFDRCDADLEAVLGAWRARLGEISRSLPELPDPGARLQGDRLLVEDRANAQLELWCRFRSRADQPLEEMRQVRVTGGACRIPMDRVTGRTVEYQLGYDLPGAGLVFEAWTSTELR